MRVGFLDSGLGLISFADAFLTLSPGVDVVLALDPDHMPYGALSPQALRQRVLRSAAALNEWQPEAIVVACNTASVHALDIFRETYEPAVPIIGTVPAIKSAAQSGEPFAVWATAATTGSAYQERLIGEFASGIEVTQVACPGFAEAIDTGDPVAIARALDHAVEHTPLHLYRVVLGCTHYGLVASDISTALAQRTPQPISLYDSPVPVARQTLRRLGLTPTDGRAPGLDRALERVGDHAPPAQTGRVLAVYLSGARGELPAAVDQYPAGQRLMAKSEPAPIHSNPH